MTRRAAGDRYDRGRMTLPPPLRPTEIDDAYAAAQCVVETHRRLSRWMRVGMTLAKIDAEVARVLEALKCRSAFLGYRGGTGVPFPSHACLSVNECVVHGTAGYLERPLEAGDVLKLDIGVVHKGWIGDAGWTYSFGPPTELHRKLMDCGKESLRRGIQTLRPGNTFAAWGAVVEDHIERECGFFVIHGLGGHGYGRRHGLDWGLHRSPYVANCRPRTADDRKSADVACRAGTLVAVEPMLSIGTNDVTVGKNPWPIFTADRSMSVHYEHDVLITEDGPRVLTEGMDELPDVVG